MGPVADSKKIAEGRRARHAAHFRRANERHRLWRVRAPCCAGVVHRRSACTGSRRRLDRARRRGAQAGPQGKRCRVGKAARRLESAGAEILARFRRAVPDAHHAGESRLRLRFPRRHGADGRPGNSLMKVVAAARLTELVAAIMQAAGSSVEESRTIARRLVDSNLVGHDSHGVIRVSKYLEWMRKGWLLANQPPTLVFDSDTLAIVDGNRGFGQVIGEYATKLGIG